MTPRTGVMICGHGSRSVAAVNEFHTLAHHLRRRLPEYDVDSGFLEFARPMIRDGLDALRDRGAERILCLPGMLFAAGHVKNDLPSEINSFAAEHPGIEVKYGRELAVDTRLLRASAERIEQAEREAGPAVGRKDTLLMVVGRGTNDPDANSNVSKVARMLWEGMGFGWTEVSYSGVAYPLVDQGLAHAARLGYRRIIVFPYFLFTGILVDRIYAHADACQAAHPELQIVKAPYLNDHPLVIDTFIERLGEMLTGANLMNCQMCKYREQIIGFEQDVGAPQAGHHHHVRGVGTDGDGHHHPHDHGHDHHAHHGHGNAHGHAHHDHGHAHRGHDHDDHPHPAHGQALHRHRHAHAEAHAAAVAEAAAGEGGRVVAVKVKAARRP
ncbi:MAG: sirohydrochlorin chelatase [Rhodospirillales bacterium]|jgi:sirohydrochlorin cobaltochelatase|nr:sirohydrochlorin chelatase [Rhodospirillales bacterium]